MTAYAAALLATGGPAAGALAVECPPAAVVEGRPEELVRDVTGALASAGVRNHAAPGCAAVLASLEGTAQHVVLRVRDPDGRASERQLATADAAATLIESWARADLAEPLLHARPPDAPPAAVTALRLGGDVLGEASVGSEGSQWVGLHTSACWRVGRFCVGPAFRLASDGGTAGGSQRVPTHRLGMDGLLGARLPLAFGRLTVAPGVALGYGWLRSENVVQVDLTTEDVDEDSTRGDAFRFVTTGLRLEASVGVSLALSRWLGVELRVASDVAPGAQVDGFAEAKTVAVEPRALVRGAIGLRVGAP